ncbi:MAG: (2Fe-2S)-binding protein [Lachnospiraceae bacterium]
MDVNELICPCMDVTVGAVKAAVASGATTVKEIQDKTGAGTICGACLDDIQNVIDQLTKES